ncbi:MAG: outer membrane beta-barrel protein [Burkholderiaceae bacterium]
MPLRTLPVALRRPVHAVTLACALAAAPSFAATSPAAGASPDATPAWIHPLVGVLLTGTVGDNRLNVKNPDGSVATGSLSGRYEALAGAEFPIDPNGLSLRLTAGIHVTASFTGAGSSEHMTSFPVEATLWYPLSDKVRVGAGMRYALHSRFSGAGAKTVDGLNATPGLVLGVGYRLMPHLLLDMRYAYERYEQASGGDLEASHWGLGLTALY